MPQIITDERRFLVGHLCSSAKICGWLLVEKLRQAEPNLRRKTLQEFANCCVDRIGIFQR